MELLYFTADKISKDKTTLYVESSYYIEVYNTTILYSTCISIYSSLAPFAPYLMYIRCLVFTFTSKYLIFMEICNGFFGYRCHIYKLPINLKYICVEVPFRSTIKVDALYVNIVIYDLCIPQNNEFRNKLNQDKRFYRHECCKFTYNIYVKQTN
jgi:hypothetical protein